MFEFDNEIKPKLYCGDNDILPQGYDGYDKRHNCLKKGYGVARAITNKDIDIYLPKLLEMTDKDKLNRYLNSNEGKDLKKFIEIHTPKDSISDGDNKIKLMNDHELKSLANRLGINNTLNMSKVQIINEISNRLDNMKSSYLTTDGSIFTEKISDDSNVGINVNRISFNDSSSISFNDIDSLTHNSNTEQFKSETYNSNTEQFKSGTSISNTEKYKSGTSNSNREKIKSESSNSNTEQFKSGTPNTTSGYFNSETPKPISGYFKPGTPNTTSRYFNSENPTPISGYFKPRIPVDSIFNDGTNFTETHPIKSSQSTFKDYINSNSQTEIKKDELDDETENEIKKLEMEITEEEGTSSNLLQRDVGYDNQNNLEKVKTKPPNESLEQLGSRSSKGEVKQQEDKKHTNLMNLLLSRKRQPKTL